MKKKIKDCTFKEFTGWANARACDVKCYNKVVTEVANKI